MPRPKPKLLIKQCVICNCEFETVDTKRGREKQTCSVECARKLGKVNNLTTGCCKICGKLCETTKSAITANLPCYCDDHRVTRYEKECIICGKKFLAKKTSTSLCSQECITQYNNNQKVTIKCAHCGKEFQQSRYNIYENKNSFCSKRCGNNYHQLLHPTRYGGTWKRWKRHILKRDNYKCLKCGAKENLEQHHFKKLRFFDNPNDAHYDDNLGTFCKKCHKEIENEYTSLTDFNERYSPNFNES